MPKNFIQDALKKFRNSCVAAVALEYEKPQGHLAFGPSVWRTRILQKLYDWEHWKTSNCECLYMWDKLRREEYELETLNIHAKHLKTGGDSVAQRSGGFYTYTREVLKRLFGHIKFKPIRHTN